MSDNNACSCFFHSVGIQIEQPAYVVVENAGTLEVCARLIPEDGSTVPLIPPQGAQTEAIISLQGFFGPPGNPTVSATLFTVESPPGPLTAIGDNI